MAYSVGERENHFQKYCSEVRVEHCIFPDCKTYEEGTRGDLESHLVTTCGSKFKQCTTCDLDVYKIYENDVFREVSKGHLCERDCLLFLAECIVDVNGDGDEDMEHLNISIPSPLNESSSHNTGPCSPFNFAAKQPEPSPCYKSNREYNYFDKMPSFRRSLNIARKTIVLQKIEY